MKQRIHQSKGDFKTPDEAARLLASIKSSRSRLKALLAEAEGHWAIEDGVYRLYHQSFKVYALQDQTLKIVHALRSLLPRRRLDPWFLEIVREGTGRRFRLENNRRWLRETRTILEAFFHAHYFLRMAVKYGSSLRRPPRILPSGWAALLCLYRIRP